MKTKLNLCLLALVIGLAFLLQNCEDDDTIVQYTLTTDVTPAMSGSVAPSSGTFDEGTEISLTATPASEYVFKNWSNGASGTENPLSVIMASDKNITAVFEKKNYSLNIVIVGEGTVTEEIIQAKSAVDYPSGTIVKLTAVPSEGWVFDKWNGHYEGSENPLQITIDKPTSITAKFEYISPKTYVPDDRFEQVLIDLGYDDVLDDYVNTDNIDKIISLQINSKDISDLKGIEDFVSLTVLNCDDNLLTSLDVSKNTKLKSLDCSNNQLTSLDVSNLIDLRGLGCKYNQITSLDISNNTSLVTLNCSGNQLTSLDISNNDFLGIIDYTFPFLDCTNNQLDCIQVNEEQLANIGIDPPIYFWFKDDTAIYSLDCNPSSKTYVPDDNFEQALINLGYDDVLDDYVNTNIIDKITNLQIYSKAISDLTGIEDFISLDILYCDKNLLTSLDISDNIALTALHCENNLLPSLDISKNTKLKVLDCSNNQLTSLDVSKLIDLEGLGCSDNQLTSLDISNNKALLLLGCSNNQLTSLDISNNLLLGTESIYKFFDCTNNPLDCIQISEQQLAGIDPLIYFWLKDDAATYSLDCNY